MAAGSGMWRAAAEAANTLTAWAIRLGIPRPPYTPHNALVVETIGRRSGKPRRVPVGYVEEDGRLVVVAEDGARAHWVQNTRHPSPTTPRRACRGRSASSA